MQSNIILQKYALILNGKIYKLDVVFYMMNKWIVSKIYISFQWAISAVVEMPVHALLRSKGESVHYSTSKESERNISSHDLFMRKLIKCEIYPDPRYDLR